MARRPAPLGVRAGLGVLSTIALLTLAASVVTVNDPLALDLEARLATPSARHPFGQDPLGRDVLARLLHGGRVSLAVGSSATAISLVIGITLGALAGYRGGWVDEALARLIDILLAFPGLLLAIALAAALGPSLRNVVLALSVLGWTGYARLVRSQVASIRERDFVLAAQSLGASPLRILTRHVLPMAAPAILVQATFGLSGAILAEASLSFLGLGAPPPLPSWGTMLAEGRSFLLVAPRLTVVPGLALTITVLALQLLGDGLRELLERRPQR